MGRVQRTVLSYYQVLVATTIIIHKSERERAINPTFNSMPRILSSSLFQQLISPLLFFASFFFVPFLSNYLKESLNIRPYVRAGQCNMFHKPAHCSELIAELCESLVRFWYTTVDPTFANYLILIHYQLVRASTFG